jgi:uncharacterized protein YjbJ (UPF0337 family)
MTWIEIEAQWPHVSTQAKSKWAKLSDHDLTLVAGNRERLVGKLEKRYGLPREDGERHVDEWGAFEATPPLTASRRARSSPT